MRGRGRLMLRLATIGVDELGRRSSRQSNIWPILGGIAGFEWGTDDASCDEFFETARTTAFRRRSGRNKFRDDPAVSGNGDALASLDSADVAAEVVLQLANAG